MPRTLALSALLSACAACPSAPQPSGPTPAAAEPAKVEPTQPSEPDEPDANPFVVFELTGEERSCPPLAKGDCKSSAELLADGTLRLDPWGEPTSPVLEAKVAPPALTAALPTLTHPALLDLLSQEKPCADANATERMRVKIGETEHANLTGYCNEEAIQEVRRVLLGLTSESFPDHHLISPPFSG